METLLATVLGFSHALGIGEEVLMNAETARRVLVEVTVPCSVARQLTLNHVRALVEAWNDAVSIDFTSEFGIRELHMARGQLNQTAFDNFIDDVRQAAPEDTLELRLTLDKAALITRVFATRPEISVTLFVFSANLTRALNGNFEQLYTLFFQDSLYQCCCILDSPRFELTGPYYCVWGIAVFQSRYDRFRSKGAERQIYRSKQRLDEVTEIRREQVGWLDFDSRLTPYHFIVSSCNDRTSAVFSAVTHLESLLAVLFIADTVRQHGTGFLATFAGAERSELLISRQADSNGEAPDIAKLFIWNYSGRTTDKLPITRSVVASLCTGTRSQNWPLLRTAAHRALITARSNYAAFVAGFVTRYFDKLKDVDEHVRAASKAIADRIADLVKTLTANLLATVGVAIGSFVAYALDKKASPDLLNIGLQVYGVYILTFPLFYSLVVHGIVDFFITQSEFNRRTLEFERSLHVVGLTTRLRDELRSRTYHFWFILCTSAIVYASIAIACFWLAKVVGVTPPTLPIPKAP